MIDAILIVATILAGFAVHEATHYVACRFYDAPARPNIWWSYKLPNPSIRTNLRAHTPTSFRVTNLAPLVVFFPSITFGFVAGLAVRPTDAMLAETAWMMWCLCVFPSPPDWKNAWNAGVLRDMRAVWFGTHPHHTAAEGITV